MMPYFSRRSLTSSIISPAFPPSLDRGFTSWVPGFLRIFMEAGCAVSTPTCGPCLGGHMGLLAAGEKCLSTTNRNFVGRMGHVDSEVYLCSPAVAAASAVAGRIISPEELLKEEN